MQNKLMEVFNDINTFLKKIYEKDNNQNSINRIRELFNKIISIIFVLAIIYFLFNLIFSKEKKNYKRILKLRNR
tara:strand:- start:1796 stop:2017 length:222 start_codon:yes stop_codon:yes gene_type:complete